MNPFGIFLTLALYYAFTEVYSRKRVFLLNPVLLTILGIVLILSVSGISYDYYNDSAQILTFLLGPAVVSLAVPLYRQREYIYRYSKQIFAGIVVGGLVAIISAVFILKLLGGSEVVMRSIAPKSITTAIAIGVSEKISGIPSLTAVLVILTGIMGNAAGVEVMNAARIKDRVARGLAMGVTAHGLGTARIILDDEVSGAVSGLGMALNGIFTSIVLPLIAVLLF
ncbi:TIGR00659 family protein [Geoglobus ahangari]|uniref:TIGR00659 family protein n=1 Tax=Geoglobus ahangari TaxID=113653 RepID=A0A0F7IE48_9EURY|nr:CidB/LrgB family autolysis modulator [Geoglobus ahangari]AKG91209.1 TIGR00659 family protein [Geoglobus ahangari]